MSETCWKKIHTITMEKDRMLDNAEFGTLLFNIDLIADQIWYIEGHDYASLKRVIEYNWINISIERISIEDEKTIEHYSPPLFDSSYKIGTTVQNLTIKDENSWEVFNLQITIPPNSKHSWFYRTNPASNSKKWEWDIPLDILKNFSDKIEWIKNSYNKDCKEKFKVSKSEEAKDKQISLTEAEKNLSSV